MITGGMAGHRGHRRRRLACLLAAGFALLAPAAASGQLLSPGVGQFITECRFSHASHNDPIVFPGRPGASHLHHFFGNRSTRARSTPRKLRRNRTSTCSNRGDASAYWVPALLDRGAPVVPIEMQAYYSSVGKNPNRIEPFPRGLKMIGGDGRALRPQPPYVTGWGCLTEPLPGFGTVGGSMPGPSCPQSGKLLLIITFPDCWDGRRLDSRDHQSHMAISRPMRAGAPRTCPASHPVSVPQLGLVVIYPISGAGSQLELSSGGLHSAHADFVNAWSMSAFRALIADCIVPRRECRT